MRGRSITETVLWHAHEAGATDLHGNPVDSWSAGSSVGIWRFSPGGTSEPLRPGQDRVITEPTIYLPPASIGAHDRVTVRGRLYEVAGDPADWVDGSFQGWVIELRKVDG